jgi:predicted NBD/HSP70 family sugar kinase
MMNGITVSSAGSILELIRRVGTTTRSQLADVTGLARSTIADRVDQLIAGGLVAEIGEAPSSGGRPPTLLSLNAGAGAILAADLGATHGRLAVCDLGGSAIAERPVELDIASGPVPVLSEVERIFLELLAECDRSPRDVMGVGIGVPGPVEFAAGRAVSPPIMPGWDRYPIRDRFVARFDVPVLVDNDVNIMTLGEHWVQADPPDDFLFLKVGTGIGSGLILGGRLHRGAQGAAGDIGHVQVADAADVPCRCGNNGCLETVAGGRALARALRADGIEAADSRAVVALVKAGNRQAIAAVRAAGRLIGQVLATTVNLLNPALIVVGGDIAEADEQLFAGIREVAYRRSTALATSRLQIVQSSLRDRAGITGAAAMVIEHVLAPGWIDSNLQVSAGATT